MIICNSLMKKTIYNDILKIFKYKTNTLLIKLS